MCAYTMWCEPRGGTTHQGNVVLTQGRHHASRNNLVLTLYGKIRYDGRR